VLVLSVPMAPRAPTLAAACCVVLALPAPAAACAGAHRRPTAATLERAARATACLIDAQRGAHGLRALRTNARLARAARRHSRQMVARRYFDHTDPGGVGPAARIAATGYLAGAHAWAIGETIAWGTGPFATPAAIVRDWMRSPPHRATILDAVLRDVGVGFARGSPAGLGRAATVTADFGARH
jgi:uncharacterized protein YkwD